MARRREARRSALDLRAELADPVRRQPELLRRASGGARAARVDLARRLPAYLVYLTAFVQDDAVHSRDDIHDRDEPPARTPAAGTTPDHQPRVRVVAAAGVAGATTLVPS